MVHGFNQLNMILHIYCHIKDVPELNKYTSITDNKTIVKNED